MMKNIFVKHRVQRHVLEVLSKVDSARFRDLRPPKTETNLLTYHLQLMRSRGLIAKDDTQYFLTQKGVNIYQFLTEKDGKTVEAPGMVIMFVIQNSGGDLLLQKRTTRPYINTWSLPGGSILANDKDIHSSVLRIAKEKLGLVKQPSVHAGNAYVRVRDNRQLVFFELTHVFKFNRDDIKTDSNTIWEQPHKLHKYNLAPAVESVVARTFFNDPFFFEEFEEKLQG